ncbi:MAG: hypothetical protein ABW185_04035 [Sedimenticola sp.]
MLRGSPWIQINTQDLNCDRSNLDISGVAGSADKDTVSKTTEFIVQASSDQCGSDSILVVDNTSNPKDLKSSKVIQQTIKEFPQLEEVQFCYSLPRGGIALHFDSAEEAREVEKNWPGPVFGEDESVHKPKGSTPKTVGYLKNISLKTSKTELEQFLHNQGCRVLTLRRLLHRHSGRPMPVWRIEFEENSDLDKAVKSIYPFKLNGKTAFCEVSRSYKVVRCYSCQRFGHIARNCTYHSRCENCGSSDHGGEQCQSEKKCANCAGNHCSFSRNCPEYQSVLRNIRKQRII